ncbi:MAG: hypothetical protein ACYSW7_10575 [Planctomycetota bacterium]|jgi:hypothetical protein
MTNMTESLISLLREPAPSLIGLAFALMGYSLILRSLKKERREVELSAQFSIKFQRGAPGVLFALFGVALVVIQYHVALVIFLQILAISAGIAFGVMGYQLFSQGVFEASDVEAVWGDKKLLLKRAAPGTVFALFGACVVVFALWKAPSLDHVIRSSPQGGAGSVESHSEPPNTAIQPTR